jgi:hypothetical protein
MLAAAILALVVGIAVACVPGAMYAVFLGAGWRAPSYRSWALRVLFATFCVELVVCGALGLTSAAWIGASVVVFTAGYFGTVVSKTRRLQAACKGLLDAGAREASLAHIELEVERRRRKGDRSSGDYRSYARTALVLASTVDAAGLSPAAIRMLEDVDASRLDPLSRAMRAQNLAAFHLRSGGRDAARDVIASVRRPVSDPVFEDALAALEALLVALEGDPKDAEDRARAAVTRAAQPTVLQTWQAVLAHALAAQGSRDEAMVLLREMRKTHGEPALERVTRHQGPASPLAESLRAETGAPYR